MRVGNQKITINNKINATEQICLLDHIKQNILAPTMTVAPLELSP